MKLVLSLLSAILLFSMCSSSTFGANEQAPAKSHAKALVEAIQDEIYDYDYEQYFFPEGGPVGITISDSKTRVPLYVNFVIHGDQGQMVYKLMPYGEIRRFFHVRSDGLVTLEGDPELGFPASQPNRKTVYLKDSEICRIKREWKIYFFDVALSPTQSRLQRAIQRQKTRTGFSKWESTHTKRR